jgi:hypothetical protein
MDDEIRPITPDEVEASRVMPAGVFEAFNEMIKDRYRKGVAQFLITHVADLIAAKLGITRHQAIERDYCDVEPFYRAAGWDVKYEQPAFNEPGEGTFTFKKVKK